MSAPKDERYLPDLPGPDPAAGPRPLQAILDDLRRPIAERYLQTKKKGGQEISFVSWYTCTRILDKYAPGWQFAQPQVTLSADGQHVVVAVQIGIPTSDYGLVWRGATGWDEEDEKGYGEPSDRAESAALRRTAAKFGLCLYLYYEKGANGTTQRNPPPVPADRWRPALAAVPAAAPEPEPEPEPEPVLDAQGSEASGTDAPAEEAATTRERIVKAWDALGWPLEKRVNWCRTLFNCSGVEGIRPDQLDVALDDLRAQYRAAHAGNGKAARR